MRSKTGLQAGLILVILLISIPASALPILVVNSGGILIGANNVAVNGNTYDVAFVDGTCASVFSVCNTAHFTFTTQPLATAASQALLDQVFINGVSGAFDGSPGLTLGCTTTTTNTCHAITPYDVAPSLGETVGSGARNTNVTDTTEGIVVAFTDDTSSDADRVWARWTVASAPEPGTGAALFGGLLTLTLIRRLLTHRASRRL